MLYLNPPYPIINGISLFPDHEDPLQWYYLPLAPKLTTIADPVSAQLIPQLQVIKFRGAAGNGGFLNFDCNIGVEEKALDDVRDELRSMSFHLPPGTVKLSPVPLVDGTVKMMLFGQESATPKPAGSGGTGTSSGAAGGGSGTTTTATSPLGDGGPKFVTRIQNSAHPALYGDNQAAFSVALDQAGVTILEKAMQGEMSPIGIVYSLDYLALRPAYSVRLNIDWDRVQKALDEQFGIDSLFASVQIDTAVDKLIENRAIVLEVDTFVPEGEDTSSIISSRDRAVNEVRDMITAAFFTSSIDPVKPAEDGWDKATRVASRVATLAATGGWAGIGTFSYKKTNYTRVDKKVLNVNMRERTTVRQSIYPQGHLSGLFRLLRDSNVDLSRFVLSVDLDDPWFQKRQVRVISRGNFEQDSIGSLDVTLRYADTPHNVILSTSGATSDLSWSSKLVNGVMDQKVATSFKVNFKDVDGTERPQSLQSEETITEVDNLEVNPRNLYSIAQVPIVPLNFPWTRYPTVEVHLRYADEANAIRMQDVFFLDSKTPNPRWNMFVRDPKKREFDYKLIFRAADNKDIEKDWITTADEEVVIRDPFPSKRSVDVVPVVSWDQVTQLFVDLSYDDPKNSVSQQSSLSFQKGSPPQTFVVDLRDPNQRRVAFEATLIFADGTLRQIPRSFTLDPRIFIRADMKGHRIVSVLPPAVDFVQNKIKQISVDLEYTDPGNGLNYANTVELGSTEERGSFEFDYVDASKSKYRFRRTIQLTNGMSKTSDWAETEIDTLIITID